MSLYNFDRPINRKALHAVKEVAITKPSQRDAIPMWIADMDFEVADEIRDALVERMMKANFGYTIADEAYYTTIQDWMLRHHQWEIDRQALILSPGIVSMMKHISRMFIKPGEKVLIYTPLYPPFKEMLRVGGADVVESSLVLNQGRFEIDFEETERLFKEEKVKCVYFCNPHNPTGRVWTEQELRQLGELCVKYDVLIFSDDVHHDWAFSPAKYMPIAKLDPRFEERTITATGPGKTFNIAGFNQCCAIIPNDQLRKVYLDYMQTEHELSVNIAYVEASKAAYAHGDNWLEQVKAYVYDNSLYLDEFLSEQLPRVKRYEYEGLFLAWLDFSDYGLEGEALEDFLLEEANVWLNGGYTYGEGGKHFMRLNLATQQATVIEALNRIKVALDRLP